MPNVAYLGLDISQADVSVCFLLTDGREPYPGGQWPTRNRAPIASVPPWPSCVRRTRSLSSGSVSKPPACYGGIWPAR